MQGGELRRDPVVLVLLVTLSGSRGDRIFLGIIEPRVVEDAFAVHFQIADIRIPIGDGAPGSGPSVIVHAGEPECRGIERG